MFAIRPARKEDAPEACALIHRSIKELCAEDHDGDPIALTGWLANKTVRNIEVWFSQLGLYSFIAERDGQMMGLGTLSGGGEIILLYVLPEARFQGVSTALLARMEEQTRALHREICSLTSSLTARRFFLSRGYELMPSEDEDDGLGLDAPVNFSKILIAPSQT